MKRTSSSVHRGDSRPPAMRPGGPLITRDYEERERRRKEWMRQQVREREHERLKKRKIEEWERKRREEEAEAKSDRGRSSCRSNSGSRRGSSSGRRREEPQSGVSKTSVMSQKFESMSNNTPLFKGPEGTKIDLSDLRRIKVDIHRNINATEISSELQRDIVNPEDIKLKRREGEGAKPIFDREELKKPVVSVSEVEEHRTVVALNNDRTERNSHSTRKRSASPTSTLKQNDHNSRREIDSRSSRHDNSRHNANRTETRRSPRHESDKGRSTEHRERSRRENSRENRSQRRSSNRDVSRDHHRDRRDRSRSADRDSRRNESRSRSSRDMAPYREHRNRSVDDSRDRRSRDDRSRERRVPLPPHYAEPMPVPMYYEGYPARPFMVGPMVPMGGQMPMGRGRMPGMMGPLRPPFPPRFMPHEMFSPGLRPTPRFGRLY